MAKTNKGFSLVELAIVIVIIGVLVSITLGLGAAQLDAAKVTSTQDQLDKINNAMTVFLKTNGYLPCPADGTLASTNANFGVDQQTNHTAGGNNSTTTNVACTGYNLRSDSTAHPNVYVGVVPTRTLNLPDNYMYDSWGNRITYIVSRYCVSSVNWANANLTSTTGLNTYACNGDGLIPTTGTDSTFGGIITIDDTSSNNITGNNTNSASGAAYLIISHGKDGMGAWTRAGTKAGSITSANYSTIEKDNGNYTGGTANGSSAAFTIYYDAKYNDGSGAGSSYFDDITRWRSAQQIYYDANH